MVNMHSTLNKGEHISLLDNCYEIAKKILENILRDWKKHAYIDKPSCAKIKLGKLMEKMLNGKATSYTKHYTYVILYTLLRENGFKILHMSNRGKNKGTKITITICRE